MDQIFLDPKWSKSKIFREVHEVFPNLVLCNNFHDHEHWLNFHSFLGESTHYFGGSISSSKLFPGKFT